MNLVMMTRKLAGVKRLHIFKTVFPQSVAEHSYNVAILLFEFCRALEIAGVETRPTYLLLRALLHDLPEAVTGDIPYPAKKVLESGDGGRGVRAMEERLLEAEGYSPHQDGVASLVFGESVGENDPSEQLFHLADMLELVLYCAEESRCGNGTLGDVYKRAVTVVKSRFQSLPDRVKLPLSDVRELALVVAMPSSVPVDAN